MWRSSNIIWSKTWIFTKWIKKIKTLIQVFEQQRQNPDPYYKNATAAAEHLMCWDVYGDVLHDKNCKKWPSYWIKCLLQEGESSAKRLLSNEDLELAQWSHILDQRHWTDNVNNQLTFGEMEIRNVCSRLQLKEREIIHGFCEQ